MTPARRVSDRSDLGALVRGAIEIEAVADGITPVRLPRQALDRMADATLDRVVRCASGVRLELVAEGRWIELDVTVDRSVPQRLAPDGRPGLFAMLASDEVAERRVRRSAATVVAPDGAVSRVSGDRETLRWDLPEPRHSSRVQIWFPPASSVVVHELRSDAAVTTSVDSGPRWVHHGSSISHGADIASPLATWPALVAQRAGLSLTNLGFGGQAQVDGFTARAIRDTPADLISVKLGINVINGDTMRERTFRPALDAFLDTVREGHPDTPLLVVGPIWCGMHEETAGPTVQGHDGTLSAAGGSIDRLTLARAREIVRDVVTHRDDDPHLAYLDGRRLFGEADERLLYDGLHPDEEGHALIAARFSRHLDESGILEPR